MFEKNENLKFVAGLIKDFVVIVLLAVFIRFFLVSPFHVSGPSMCNTINYIGDECVNKYGEYVLVNEFMYQELGSKQIGEPKFKDIIVFRPPSNPTEFYIKRIIGVPGDKIKIEDGKVYKFENDAYKMLDEKEYLKEDVWDKTFVSSAAGEAVEFEVPDDAYFVMGDNRTRSTDSRVCFRAVSPLDCREGAYEAFVPRDSIRGRAWFVFWPLNRFRFL